MADLYEQLRGRLDLFPQSYPKTESGAEIEILKRLFTPEEAKVMLYLRPYPETPSVIAERAGEDETVLADTLYSMSKRGLIYRHRSRSNQIYYLMIPWMIGIWEFQLNDLNPENIDLYEKFYQEGMVPSWRKQKTGIFRVLPIEKEIHGGTEVQPYEKVSEIIESHTRFAVADCICRKERRMVGDACDRPLDVCLSFGPSAAFYIENGLGREITKEETKQILLRAEEAGLIHCSANHAGRKDFICNCCGCCCKAIANITKFDNPGAITTSNYYAVKDYDTCTTCGTCVDRCQVGAIRIEKEMTVINRDKCIGCGLCVSTCPTGSISLKRKTIDEAPPILANELEVVQAMARERGKQFPFE